MFKLLILIIAVLALAAWFAITAGKRKEAFAAAALEDARLVAEQGFSLRAAAQRGKLGGAADIGLGFDPTEIARRRGARQPLVHAEQLARQQAVEVRPRHLFRREGCCKVKGLAAAHCLG